MEEQKEDRRKAKEQGKDVAEITDEDYQNFYAAVQNWEEQDQASATVKEEEDDKNDS